MCPLHCSCTTLALPEKEKYLKDKKYCKQNFTILVLAKPKFYLISNLISLFSQLTRILVFDGTDFAVNLIQSLSWFVG